MNIQLTTLPNGLRVVTDCIPEVSTVSMGMWVNVGTRQETPDINGVAHLIEHMLFKGTPRRSAFEISEQIESVGGHLNAYTTREQTAYYAKVLHDDKALALDILADMIQHSVLDELELNRERTVILQEIGQAKDAPDDIIYDYAQDLAFPRQSLGMPVLGSAEIISTIPRHKLTEYLARHYATPHMVFVSSGNIHHEDMVDRVAKAFDSLPEKGQRKTDPGIYKGGDYREARDLEQLHLIFGMKGVAYHHPDYYACSILSTLLGGGMSSRLFQEVREKRGLVYSIHSFASAYNDNGFFGIYAGTGPEHANELIPVVCDEILKISDTLTETEFQRARSQLRAGLLMGLESTMARCEHFGQSVLIHDRLVLPEETLKKLEKVSSDDVRRMGRELTAQPLTFTAIGPVSGLESYDAIQARLKR